MAFNITHPTSSPERYSNSSRVDFNECPSSEAWEWLYMMQPAFMAFICVAGTIGNVFVLCVFCFHRKKCSVAEIYLSNLAVADLVMVSCLPFWAVTIANEFNWNFGDLLCRLVNVAISMNLFSSILFLVLVSIDRYLAFVRPMTAGRMRRATWAKKISLGIWITSFLFSLPVLIFRSVKYFPEFNALACYLAYPHEGWRVRHNLIINIVGFLIPLVVISFCSYQIIQTLKKNEMKQFSAARTERKASILILAVVLVFLVCWVPFHIVMLLDTLFHYQAISGCHWEDILDVGEQISTYLAYSNSSLNPILYVIVGKQFRKKAKGLFRQISSWDVKGKVSQVSKFTSTLKYFESTQV
ncbi:B2 bradykinin receptor isoform X2 [Lepisosteus oculatus]|uniref:B2 bradykinin receptor n=1 Tax=Lepisosteus oculatus TaxID=7918 RepID=W5NME2_LEPOC|nr:PREDICTED: B2 bradykinin receptor-like [Lepisosteus oculatus]